MEPNLPQKSRSKLNLHERPSSQTLTCSTLLCINVIWTTSLLYLTWSMFLSQNDSSLTRPYDAHSSQHHVSKVATDDHFSPMIDVGNTVKTMNGRLKDNSTIYRQPPSAQVDKAWAEAWHSHEITFNVTADDLRRAGIDPASVVVWNDVEDAYPAEFEYTHLIHCLDTVRKEMWHEHYFPPSTKPDPEQTRIRQEHAMHCVHMLLQDIMCHAELNLIPLIWMPYSLGRAGRQYAPTGMFSTTKVCRDIDTVNQWLQNKHTADANAMLAKLKPPPNAKLFTDDGYFADR